MEERKVIRNFDGEEIDLTSDDLLDKLTFETANFLRRFTSYIIDLIIIFIAWYLFTKPFFHEIDNFIKTLGELESDFDNIEKFMKLRDLVWKLFMNLVLVWLACKAVYFSLIPAIIGKGRTIGKLLAGIGVVDITTLEEISPTRLIMREVLCRTIIETLFVIPNIVSCCLAFYREDSRSLHDLITKTTVIKLDLYDVESS